jgi:hypothetical protein
MGVISMDEGAKDKKEKQIAEAVKGAQAIGIGDYCEDDALRRKESVPKDFGLCSSCSSFTYVRTEFDIPVAQCGSYAISAGGESFGKLQLHTGRPVTDCTNFDRVGSISLREMYDMAVMIDISKRVKVGFIKED